MANSLIHLGPRTIMPQIHQVLFSDLVINIGVKGYFEKRYYQVIHYSAILLFFYSFATYYLAPLIIPIVMGDEWINIVPIFQLFCALVILNYITVINNEMAKILGFAYIYSRYVVIRSVLTILIILLASTYSLKMVVIALIILNLLVVIVDDIIFFKNQEEIIFKSSRLCIHIACWVWALFVISNSLF